MTPDHVEQYVKSTATQSWSGPVATKLRFTRSGARTAAGSALLVNRFLARLGAPDTSRSHEAGHLVPADIMSGLTGRLGQLAPSIDRGVVTPQRHQDRDQPRVTDRPTPRAGGTRSRSKWKGRPAARHRSAPHRCPPVVLSRWASIKAITAASAVELRRESACRMSLALHSCLTSVRSSTSSA